jgi:fucose 4-O-acetylase-like acetyltransferase
VCGHVIGGLRDAGLVTDQGAFSALFYLIYTFHMPMFFLLSGIFVESRLTRSRPEFLRSTLSRIVWPYFLWSIIQLAVINVLGSLANTPVPFDFESYVALIWRPSSQFWYLHILFIFLISSCLIVPHFGAKWLFAVSIFVYSLQELYTFAYPLSHMCRFFPFYALGVLLGGDLVRARASDTRALLIATCAAGVWLVCASDARGAGYGYWSDGAIPAAIAGTLAWLALANVPQVAQQPLLRSLGQRSLAIFLLHVLFVAGTRIVLHKLLGIAQPLMIFPLAIVAGVAGPLLVYTLARRLNLERQLGLG